MRVFLADDHSLVREGIRKILSAESDMSIVGEASSAEEALESLRTIRADILLLDISLPGKSGIEMMADLKAMDHTPRVLFLSMHPERLFAVRALKVGAFGYLTKDSAAEELVAALRRIHRGGHYISQTVSDQMAEHLTDGGGSAGNIDKLSPRELDILRRIASGQKPQSIARELFIAPSTVSTYRLRILQKLGLKNTPELIRFALDNHLIS